MASRRQAGTGEGECGEQAQGEAEEEAGGEEEEDGTGEADLDLITLGPFGAADFPAFFGDFFTFFALSAARFAALFFLSKWLRMLRRFATLKSSNIHSIVASASSAKTLVSWRLELVVVVVAVEVFILWSVAVKWFVAKFSLVWFLLVSGAN